MGAFVTSMRAVFSAVLTGGAFFLAVTAMTGCASAEQQRRWQIEAVGGTSSPTERAAARERAREARRIARSKDREREIRRARVYRYVPSPVEPGPRRLAVVGDQRCDRVPSRKPMAWMQTARWRRGGAKRATMPMCRHEWPIMGRSGHRQVLAAVDGGPAAGGTRVAIHFVYRIAGSPLHRRMLGRARIASDHESRKQLRPRAALIVAP